MPLRYISRQALKKPCCDVVGLILLTSNRGTKKEDTVCDFHIPYTKENTVKNIHEKTNNKSWASGVGIVAALRETNLARFDFQAWQQPEEAVSGFPSCVERCPTSWKNGVWHPMRSSSSRSFQFNGLMDPSFGFRSWV